MTERVSNGMLLLRIKKAFLLMTGDSCPKTSWLELNETRIAIGKLMKFIDDKRETSTSPYIWKASSLDKPLALNTTLHVWPGQCGSTLRIEPRALIIHLDSVRVTFPLLYVERRCRLMYDWRNGLYFIRKVLIPMINLFATAPEGYKNLSIQLSK